VPEDWRKANVTPIFKKDKKEDTGNYRPVSFTSIPGKVMEQLILGVIIKLVEEKKVIRSRQHGFTKGKSCFINFLIMQVRRNEIAERSPKAIKRNLRALGRLVEGSGAQVVFTSVPSVAGTSTEKGRKTHLINRCLRDWCH